MLPWQLTKINKFKYYKYQKMNTNKWKLNRNIKKCKNMTNKNDKST